MVEAIDTTLALAARGVSLSRTPVAKPQASMNRPDAPAQETARPERSGKIDSAALSKAPVQNDSAGNDARAAAGRTPITPLTNDSGLTTYRDQESGRVVVRIFDRESGDVLVEFPPENQRQAAEPPGPPDGDRPNTALDV
jgi:hypothetical protein